MAVQLESADDDPPPAALWVCRKSDSPDRYTMHRISPAVRSHPDLPPSRCACFRLPLIARNRLRWSHRPESPAGRTTDHPGTIGGGSHQCATTFPESVSVVAAFDGLAGRGFWRLARRPAAPFSPTYS